MRKVVLFMVGALFGLAFGSTLMLMLTPASGRAMRMRAKNRLDRAKEEARLAALDKQRQLQAELQVMTGVKLDSKGKLLLPKR